MGCSLPHWPFLPLVADLQFVTVGRLERKIKKQPNLAAFLIFLSVLCHQSQGRPRESQERFGGQPSATGGALVHWWHLPPSAVSLPVKVVMITDLFGINSLTHLSCGTWPWWPLSGCPPAYSSSSSTRIITVMELGCWALLWMGGEGWKRHKIEKMSHQNIKCAASSPQTYPHYGFLNLLSHTHLPSPVNPNFNVPNLTSPRLLKLIVPYSYLTLRSFVPFSQTYNSIFIPNQMSLQMSQTVTNVPRPPKKCPLCPKPNVPVPNKCPKLCYICPKTAWKCPDTSQKSPKITKKALKNFTLGHYVP